MTEFVSFGRTVSAELSDATQFATVRTVGVVKGKPEGSPVATLQRARVLDRTAPPWQLFDTDGELLYSWRYAPPYQALIDTTARVLARAL